MKKLQSTTSFLSLLCLCMAVFSGCEPEDAAPTPEKFSISYQVSLKNVDDGREFVFQKDALEFAGSDFGVQGEGYKRINIAIVLDSATNGSLDAYVYADSNNILIPLGESYNHNPDNISEMVMVLNGDRYISENTAGTALHSLSNVTYYSKALGKVTYRYEFENVPVIKETGSPESYIVSGHVICKAEE